MDTLNCIATSSTSESSASERSPAKVVGRRARGRQAHRQRRKRPRWRFVVVGTKTGLANLAQHCPRGRWLEGADLAIIILTSPRWPFHLLDAGRVLQDMRLAPGTLASDRG